MNTERVHPDYARAKVAGQRHRFGAWAKKAVQAMIPIAPRLAADMDLERLPDCDRLWIHYEAGRSPNDAALAACGGRWR